MTAEKNPARPVLVIGATCVDVVIYLDRLPAREGHCRVLSQLMSLGGCAYNVANILRQSGAPFKFITPVGSGLYGDFVRKELEREGFSTDILIPQENGCCYCLVEPDGERSFIPFHGGEYTFDESWVSGLDISDYGYIYIGGIELNEPTGGNIAAWLEKTIAPAEHEGDGIPTADTSGSDAAPQILFAVSPHIGELPPALVNRVCALHPILHMSEAESFVMSGSDNVSDAALLLRERTGNAVIITLGDKGALCLEKEGDPYIVPVKAREALDTTGAGDAHAGALLSALSRGASLSEAVSFANDAASAVVTFKGASLPDDFFASL